MVLHNLDRAAGYQMLPDIVVRAANGELVAAIEVKAGDALSPEVVIALRSNLAVHEALSEIAFFLLVTRQRGFLWLPHAQPWLDASPSVEFPMQPVIERYLHGSDAERQMWQGELILIVADWLHDLNLGLGDTALEPERSLAASGFLAAMRRAAVVDATA
jgi:hypothetical protein